MVHTMKLRSRKPQPAAVIELPLTSGTAARQAEGPALRSSTDRGAIEVVVALKVGSAVWQRSFDRDVALFAVMEPDREHLAVRGAAYRPIATGVGAKGELGVRRTGKLSSFLYEIDRQVSIAAGIRF